MRMVQPSQQALVARHIGSVGLGLYAHQSYLRDAPKLRDPQSLGDEHALIGFDREQPYLRDLIKKMPISRAQLALRTDSDLAALAAVRAGFGIGFIQHAIARRDPALIAVFPKEIGFTLDIWLALHEDLRASRRLRLMLDHLAAGLAEHVARSRG